MSECIFCRLVNRELEASFVYMDDHIAAFMDLSPVAPGHLLVAPVRHYSGITDLPLDVGARMWNFAHRISSVVLEGSPGAEGLNILMSQGEVAQQSVPHAHLHVIPRAKDDSMILTSSDHVATREELDDYAELLRFRIREHTSL